MAAHNEAESISILTRLVIRAHTPCITSHEGRATVSVVHNCSFCADAPLRCIMGEMSVVKLLISHPVRLLYLAENDQM